MDKLVFNCTTGEIEEANFTPEEIAQREYEASLPPVIPEPTELELLQADLDATKETLNFVLMNF